MLTAWKVAMRQNGGRMKAATTAPTLSCSELAARWVDGRLPAQARASSRQCLRGTVTATKAAAYLVGNASSAMRQQHEGDPMWLPYVTRRT